MFNGLEVLNNKSACLILSINISEHGSILCKLKKIFLELETKERLFKRCQCVGALDLKTGFYKKTQHQKL